MLFKRGILACLILALQACNTGVTSSGSLVASDADSSKSVGIPSPAAPVAPTATATPKPVASATPKPSTPTPTASPTVTPSSTATPMPSATATLSVVAFAFGAQANKQIPVRSDSQSPALPLGFYIYLPPNYDPHKSPKYPVVMWLHGYGEKGSGYGKGTGTTDLPDVEKAGLPNYIKSHLTDTTPNNTILSPGGNPLPVLNSIVISPQGFWQSSGTPELLSDLLDVILANYNADDKRVYVTGWSYGSDGTTVFSRNYASRIAAIAPFSGTGANTANKNLADVPMWAAMSSYEAPSGGTTCKPMGYAISQSRVPFNNLTSSYPWSFNTNGTVVSSSSVTESMAIYRKSTGKWSWDTSGSFNDYSLDDDVTAIYSIPVSSAHDHAWKMAYVSPVFWNWMFKQSK